MFNNLMREIWSKVDGLENVVLAGLDAIIVARQTETDYDDLIVAEVVSLIREAQHFGNELGSGNVSSFSTHFLHRAIFVQMVTPEYFLVGVAHNLSNLSALRYQFKLKAYEWFSAIA